MRAKTAHCRAGCGRFLPQVAAVAAAARRRTRRRRCPVVVVTASGPAYAAPAALANADTGFHADAAAGLRAEPGSRAREPVGCPGAASRNQEVSIPVHVRGWGTNDRGEQQGVITVASWTASRTWYR